MKQLFKTIVVAVLTFQAKVTLRRHKPTVIAITGSVGKTSTKDAIYSAIKDHQATRKSEKSFNSEIGVPLTILGLRNGWSNPFRWLQNCISGFFVAFFSRQYPAVLVLETGVDQPGDMESLIDWLVVDIVVVTRLPDVPVHVEFFADADAQRAEEFSLIKALKPDGVLIYNADDMHTVNRIDEVLQQTKSYGRMLPADVHATKDAVVYKDDQPTGMRFTLQTVADTVTVEVSGTVGLHSVYASAAAMAVAVELGIEEAAAASALTTQVPPPGRMRIIPGIKGSLVIDDSYNASPVALQAALESLAELKYAKRRIVVLGDMMELGKFSPEAHKEAGERIARVTDVLFTIGPRTRATAAAALASGLDEANIFQYEKTARAGRELQAMLKPGDVVLVKASQSIRAERIVEEVMAEPERAGELLCRQDSAWKRL